MIVKNTDFDDLLIVELEVFEDDRGYLVETYSQDWFFKELSFKSVLELEVKSKKNVLRGMHYQLEPYAQAKIIKVIEGSVLDVVVDIRKNSRTFGKSFSIELSGDTQNFMYVPRGFAHGYCVLSDAAVMSYKLDNIFCKEYARGIAYNDKTLDIDWNINGNPILSEQDKNFPTLEVATSKM